jgi:hypothetical protein
MPEVPVLQVVISYTRRVKLDVARDLLEALQGNVPPN